MKISSLTDRTIPFFLRYKCVIGALIAIVLLTGYFASAGYAQTSDKKLSREQLEQLVAPIALYPDALLAQVLMASTYPLEIVQAERWQRANAKLAGKALEDELVKQSWDPSVKSLVAVPQTLHMMNEKLDWTEKLGNAFLAQQEDILGAVQTLRTKAQKAETLKTNSQQKVSSQTTSGKTVVVIEQTNPQVIYVPAYNPTVVYGVWPYPAYPPYVWYPPGYVASNVVSFAAGVAVGAALWGNCNWGQNNVNINVNQYNSYNRTNISNSEWQHNTAHRKGVPYANSSVAERYGKGSANTASREAFRGRAESGQLDARSKDGGARTQPQRDADPGRAPQPDARSKGAQTKGGAVADRGAGSRLTSSDHRGSQAFSDVSNGPDARRQSERGQMSRQGSQIQRGAGPPLDRAGGGVRGAGGELVGGRR